MTLVCQKDSHKSYFQKLLCHPSPSNLIPPTVQRTYLENRKEGREEEKEREREGKKPRATTSRLVFFCDDSWLLFGCSHNHVGLHRQISRKMVMVMGLMAQRWMSRDTSQAWDMAVKPTGRTGSPGKAGKEKQASLAGGGEL